MLGLAAVALPLWLALAISYDIWAALKLDFRDLDEFKWLPQLQAWVFYSTGLITFVSIACLVYSLHGTIGHVFIVTSVVGLIFIVAALFAATFRIRHYMAHNDGQEKSHP